MMVVRKLYDRLTPRVVSVGVGAGVLSPTSLAARRRDADPESRRLDVAVFGGFAVRRLGVGSFGHRAAVREVFGLG